MIALTRSRQTTAADPKIKILGLGGAGTAILEQVIHDGSDGAECIALNTDAQSLASSSAPVKLHLGSAATRGLGTGGDPDAGYTAAEESSEHIKAALDSAQLVFLCAGLGGGTGSGAAPLVAHLARTSGTIVVAFVTLPFTFEGKRRSQQAAVALEQLEQQADLVVCFENDRMSDARGEDQNIQQAFLSSDQLVSQSIRAITAMSQRRSPIGIGLDDLAAVLHRQAARCLFGHGESEGSTRAHAALEQALSSPLMKRGELLADAHAVLVHIASGADATLREITQVMEDFNRYVNDNALVHFGVTTDPQLGQRLSISILSSTGLPIAKNPPILRPALARRADPEMRFDDVEAEPIAAPEAPRQPAPDKPKARATPVYAKIPAARKEEKAEQMALEPANRGRFDKGEPTIVNGEDLDVPTFLRKTPRAK